MEVIDEALTIVHGKGEMLFPRIAEVWSGILGTPVSGEEVALCMAGLKLVRRQARKDRDSLVDLIGYGVCIDEMNRT